MHHAEHFLTRLDRLATSEVDLALELYRDPGLLRAILGAVALPDQAQRVAISLSDPQLGPFLIVTRDGHFVTCLGRGMKPGEHPVVTRGQLDGLSAKFGVLRERLALATKLVGSKESACARLLRRVLVSADTVSREDFLGVSAWEPMLAPVFMTMYMGVSADLLQQAPALRSLRRSNGKVEQAMREYWNLLHAAGHLALLATMGGEREHYRQVSESSPIQRSAFSWSLGSTGIMTFILRGAWAAGRLGKVLLPTYKKALVEDVALFELLDTVFSLVAIGRRTSGLRGEIAKALRAAPHTATTPQAKALREGMEQQVTLVCEIAAQVLDVSDEGLQPEVERFGEALLGELSEPVPEDLRRELVRLLPLNNYADGITDGRKVLTSLSLIAATARGAPEQFYYPKAIHRIAYEPWRPEFTQHVLEPIKRAERAAHPMAVRSDAPGPNQPCSCGSGRKYKKCCGSPAGRPPSQAGGPSA